MRRGRPRAYFAASPSLRVALTADALQLAQELGVGAGLFELLYKELQLLIAVERAQDAANLPDPLGLGGLHKEFLLARARVLDVDGRVDPLVRELALQMNLHVSRTLELLVDDLVHAAPGLDERTGDDRKRSAVLDVPSRAEKLLWRVERRRIDAAGEDTPRSRCREVVCPREARDRIEQHDHVLALLYEPLDPLED